jgi:hypothetical protein
MSPNSRNLFVAGLLVAIVLINVVVFVARRNAPGDLPESIAVAPLELRTRLVNTLRSESLSTSVDRLPQFDDTVWVMGSIEPDTALSQRSYRYQSQFVPRLNRVRKIVEQTSGPEAGAAELSSSLLLRFGGAMDKFGDVLIAKNQQITASPHGVICREPDDYWSRVVYAPAAAYLLSELKVTAALPRLSQALQQPGPLPVNRVFLFFAAHQLVKNCHRDTLSADAASLLDQYLASTGSVPAAQQVEQYAWDAAFEDNDCRFVMLHRQPDDSDDLRRLPATFYPSALAAWDAPDEAVHATLQTHIESLARFVSSVTFN